MLRRTAFVLFTAFNLCACGALGWQTLEVENLSYGDVFNLTVYVIDTEGFVIDSQDSDSGLITTFWDYKKMLDVARFPIRRKVEAHVDPSGDDRYIIDIRIRQEALWENYATVDVKNQKGWDLYGSDKETTHSILTRIKLLTREFKPSDDFYQQRKQMDELRGTIPDVLEEDESDFK